MLSDCHLTSSNSIGRLDDVFEAGISKFSFVLEYASKNDCLILQAGDFLDSSRSWMLHSRLVGLFKKYPKVQIFIVRGQHDFYMYSEKSKDATSLGVFVQLGYLHELDEVPINITREIHLYGCSWGQKIPVPRYNKKEISNILVIHAPILATIQFKGQNYIKALSFLEKNKDYDLILCGDIHQKFFFEKEGRYILNTGPMLRLEANFYNLKHHPCFAVLDLEKWKVKWVEIPCSSADGVLSRKHIESRDESQNMLDEFVHVVNNAEFKGVDFFQNLNDYMMKNRVRKEVRQVIEEIRRKEE